MRISIIGSGNVATHLALALYGRGHKIDQIWSRNLDHATTLAQRVEATPIDDISQLIPNANVYILAVADDAIRSLAKDIRVGNALVLHTSGATPKEVLEDCSFRFGVAANCGADGPSNTRFVDATTAVACPAPTGLTAVPVEGDSTAVTINWDPIDGTAWQLCINGDTSSLIDVTELPYLLENLTPETSYTVKVRRDCSDDNDGFSAWSSTVTFEPTAKTVIGSFQTTSSNLPTNCYYKYALTQQLYTAAELGEAGTIMSVDFMCQGNQTRNIDIYMVSTANNTLTSFIPVSAADLVFSGSVNFTSNNWTSIQLTTPFIYGGTGNVVIVNLLNRATRKGRRENVGTKRAAEVAHACSSQRVCLYRRAKVPRGRGDVVWIAGCGPSCRFVADAAAVDGRPC